LSTTTRVRIDWAPVFEPLLTPARYRAAHGGRGSGKSHFFASLSIRRSLDLAARGEGARIVCLREVQKTLKESVKLLIEDKIRAHDVGAHFGVFHDKIVTPGDGIMIFQGMQDHTAQSVKSLEGFDIAYVEEAQTLSARSLELLRPTIRKAGSELWFGWNPRSAADPVDQFLRGISPPEDAVVVRANFMDNPWFSKELEAERAYDEAHNKQRYGHIWLGEYEPTAVGAIWDRATLHAHRRDKAPPLDMVVIGCDPAMSNDKDSDEYGVITCGKGSDGRGYVIDDSSDKFTPHQWAVNTVALYDLHEADAVILEDNQGGDHVEQTLKAVRPDLRIIRVHVTRRKPDRAKPISALYQLGRVSHCGTFSKLEDQQCMMTSVDYTGDGSPDRVDALVLAMTHLFPQMQRVEEKPRPTGGPHNTEHAWMG